MIATLALEERFLGALGLLVEVLAGAFWAGGSLAVPWPVAGFVVCAEAEGVLFGCEVAGPVISPSLATCAGGDLK